MNTIINFKRNPAKLIKYQGQLIKKVSNVSNINNKNDMLQILCVSVAEAKPADKKDAKPDDKKEEDPKKPKYTRDILKCQVIKYKNFEVNLIIVVYQLWFLYRIQKCNFENFGG